MSVHTLSPRMVCPDWCAFDATYPETWPGGGDGAIEHMRQLGTAPLRENVHYPDATRVIVTLTRWDCEGGGGDPVSVEAITDTHNALGRWSSPASLREYAALLTAAADELEAAQAG